MHAGSRERRTTRGWRPGRHDGLDARRLAQGLGWFSIGLAVAGLVAPRLLARAVGVRQTPGSVTALRLVGLREIVSGVGILKQSRPAGWIWFRVAGDVMDLALLGSAMTARRARRDRLGVATAAVLGVTALDVLCGRQLSNGFGTGTRSLRTGSVRRSITLNRPAEALYRFWRDFSNLPRFMRHLESVQVMGERRSHWKAKGPGGVTVEWNAEITEERPSELIAWRTLPGSQVDHSGVVRFQQAPGGRGTQVTVEMEYAPPGGAITATMAWLIGQAPEQQVAEDLRRFKQLVEIGEVVVSDGLLDGAAQPSTSTPPRQAVAKGGAR